MNRTIKIPGKTASLYVLIAILLIAGHAKAVPLDYAHRPIPCFGCHGETLNIDYGPGECGNCHKYYLNVPQLEKEHNPKICKACHIGETLANGTEKEIFHNGHKAVSCTKCHTEDNFTVLKIKSDGFKCVFCHGVKVHSIHAKNINKACPICHGSWAAGKVYQGTKAPSLDKPEDTEKYEGITAFHFIRSLINMLLGIK
ncbi:MAG: hypothetical protein OIN66_15600 [Candidatus Methanoperedens sp.]|nr:hypothetical protein [Candidatus Methanoperedens sp.]